MEFRNQTLVTEFSFVGLTNCFQHQVVLFVVFLLVYLVTLLGNVGMITLIWMDSRLHTPMYFFLSHLSFVDVCSSSVIGPRMLTDIFVKKKVISFLGCAAQLWFFGQFVVTECFLLASMAYDRYMAICKPLLYTLIMSRRICVQLVVGPYTMGLISAITHTTFAFRLPYCGPNTINHFFCDLLPVLSLACADTQVNQVLLFILAGALGVLSGVIILVSYIYIVVTILRIRSAEGRRKAFSTCSSHLTAVSILYGTLFFIY
uniref:olfactory receptor 5G25-like n=1 Tax=Panthera onca TaxID=9690 RepID=UPI00295340FC